METNRGTKISLLIKEVNVLMSQSIKQMFDETGLTTPQIMVMALLSRHGNMKVSEISEKLNLSNSTISGIIDRLEKQSYVKRIRSKEDRRVVHVSLAPKSDSIMHTAIHETIEQNLAQKMKKADTEQIDAIINGLETLKSLLEN